MRIEKPKAVQKAMREGNTHALRAMGQKGAERSALKRDERVTLEDIDRQKRAKDEFDRKKEANEDIAPID